MLNKYFKKATILVAVVGLQLAFGQEHKHQHTHFCGLEEHSNEKQTMALQENRNTDLINKISFSNEVTNFDALRVYRLAILIRPDTFKNDFHSDKAEVRKFWKETITKLNEIYQRDVGVKFELVDNDKLIVEDPSIISWTNQNTSINIFEESTKKINEIIGEDNYDLGIIIGRISDTTAEGATKRESVYEKENKARCVSPVSFDIIAHEIGHMFGAVHTAKEANPSSLMSILTKRENFFSVESISIMRLFLSTAPYKNQFGEIVYPKNPVREYTNIPRGITLGTLPPTIDENKIKAEYTVPIGSNIQFYIPATTTAGKLNYRAFPVDNNLYEKTQVRANVFKVYSPKETNDIEFPVERYKDGNTYNLPKSPSTYNFLLTASNPKSNAISLETEKHLVQFAQKKVKVNFVNGTALKANYIPITRFYTGQKAELNWSYDTNIFKGAKLRILMSNDNGESFQVVKEGVPIENGKTNFVVIQKPTNPYANEAKIKLEVEDNITYDVIESSKTKGFREIKQSNIVYSDSPNLVELDSKNTFNNIDIYKPTAKCRNQNIPVSISTDENLQEPSTDTEKVVIWKASCDGSIAYFRQKFVLKKDDNTLTINENTAKSISLYPNPVNNEFSLKGIENIREVKIFDFTGRIVKSFGKQEVYNISDLPKGVYIVVVNGEEKIKIIKE